MDIGTISSRYAKALYKYCQTHDETEKAYVGMSSLKDAYEKLHQLKVVLESPTISAKSKHHLLCTAAGQTKSDCLKEFFKVVIKNNRANMMIFIAQSYINLYHKEKDLILCELTVPSQLQDTTVDKIKSIVEAKTSKQVDFSVNINPAIIGGFVLEYDALCLDASVAGQLKSLRKKIV